jgi:thiamine-monophosphate kinase
VGTKRAKSLNPDAVVPWLTSSFKRDGWKGLLAGVGEDDCGVIQIEHICVVLSVDFLNATPIAEQLGLGGERVLGRLAVAATLADLLGSGAAPRALLVAVTVPHGYQEHLFKEIMRGAKSESMRWNVPIIAGDTKLGRARAVSTCGLGTVDSPKQLFLANRAQPGDIIFASGPLGTCAAATCISSGRVAVPRWAHRAITVPELPMGLSRRLAMLQVAHGGIDISDGLAADLRRMCNASRVGAILDVDTIPIDPRVYSVADREQVPPWAFSLSSGGDFQFIVTVPPKARAAVERLGFSRIGMITRERRFWLRDNAQVLSYKLPDVGHRDRQGQRFLNEIRGIIRRVSNERKKA